MDSDFDLSFSYGELSDIGGPLLSDTLDAYHLACYQALDAERGYCFVREKQ